MDVVRLAAGGLVMAGRQSEPILGGCGDDLVLITATHNLQKLPDLPRRWKRSIRRLNFV